MLAKASPRKPRVLILSRSSKVDNLLVAWLVTANSNSLEFIPSPLSLIVIRFNYSLKFSRRTFLIKRHKNRIKI